MRVRIALIPLVAAAALLAGCATTTGTATPTTPAGTPTPTSNGVASLSADEILAKANTAVAAAKSFHAKGQETTDGTTTGVDLVFAGTDFSGSLQTGGVTIELISIGDSLYIKAPDSFWTSQLPASAQSAVAAFKGKYVKVNGKNAAFSGLKDSLNPATMFKPEGTITKGDAKTIGGTPTIGLVDSKNSGVLYIATQGEPYPVREETTGGAGVDFTEYNAAAPITAPATADVYDLTPLMGA